MLAQTRRQDEDARMATAESTPATVFVIDDDHGIRSALDSLLRSAGWNVKAYASASEFLDETPTGNDGCILLDVSMPGMSGPELHDRILERGIAYPVIYLTGHCSVSIGVKAMKSGAIDFLEKPVDETLLLPAIENAIGRHSRARAGQAKLDAMQARLMRLSAREREVMDHVIAGRLNKQIAIDMGIAEKTVKVHRGRVMKKMEVRSVAQLVQLCDDLGIRTTT
jgi:FixJ family two-component response regulator